MVTTHPTSIKLFLMQLHKCNFATVTNHNVNIYMQPLWKGRSTLTNGVVTHVLRTTDLSWRLTSFWCRPETTANQMLDLVLWLTGFWGKLNSQPPSMSTVKVRWLVGKRTGCCNLECVCVGGPGAGALSMKHWWVFITRGLSTQSRNSPPALGASLPTSSFSVQVTENCLRETGMASLEADLVQNPAHSPQEQLPPPSLLLGLQLDWSHSRPLNVKYDIQTMKRWAKFQTKQNAWAY